VLSIDVFSALLFFVLLSLIRDFLGGITNTYNASV